MSKFGFEVGKGLGRNGQGTPHAIPFTKNKNKTALGAQGGLVNMTTPIHKALEVEHNTTLESNSKASEKSSSSIPSTSNSCACCYNIDIQTCATNHVEMNAMRKEISRLTQLLQDPNEQSSKTNPDSRVGEFEKHTKGFGSKYMSKFGFKKGKGLGKDEQGIPQSIPFVKNNKTAVLGANGGLVNLTTPIRKEEKKNQASSHVKFIKRGTTCDEGAKIVAYSSKQDKFETSRKSQTQEPSSHVSFYADFVLTRNHHGKVVAKFVGPRTFHTKVKSSVWVPKVLVTNVVGPKYCWVPKRKE